MYKDRKKERKKRKEERKEEKKKERQERKTEKLKFGKEKNSVLILVRTHAPLLTT